MGWSEIGSWLAAGLAVCLALTTHSGANADSPPAPLTPPAGLVVIHSDAEALEALMLQPFREEDGLPIVQWIHVSRSYEAARGHYSVLVGKVDCPHRAWAIKALVHMNNAGEMIDDEPIMAGPDSYQGLTVGSYVPTYVCETLRGLAQDSPSPTFSAIAAWVTLLRSRWPASQ